VIFGTLIALEQVDFNVTGFIAGLGIAGFTIGFALQDIARNFVSGLILLYRQPFQIGDFIEVCQSYRHSQDDQYPRHGDPDPGWGHGDHPQQQGV
jgi:hypothetical protein